MFNGLFRVSSSEIFLEKIRNTSEAFQEARVCCIRPDIGIVRMGLVGSIKTVTLRTFGSGSS